MTSLAGIGRRRPDKKSTIPGHDILAWFLLLSLGMNAKKQTKEVTNMTIKYSPEQILEQELFDSFQDRDWDIHQRNEKFHIRTLREAFSQVASRSNWKAPIAWIIEGKDRAVVDEAIVFFTGSVPTFTKAEGDTGRLVVKAEGYYSAIGA